MKIAIAQIRPYRGDVAANIKSHLIWIERAASVGASLVIFPELSLTGYEPARANALAMQLDDTTLAIFQEAAEQYNLTIGLGVPIRQGAGITIATVLFGPGQARQLCTKQYLHPDEESYFVAGNKASSLISPRLSLAICYELSVEEHAEKAAAEGADIYLASVAKSAVGIQKAQQRLAAVSQTLGMTTVLANCIGLCEDFRGAGQSFVLDKQGKLVGQLPEDKQGLLLLNDHTDEVVLYEDSEFNFPYFS